VSVGFFNISLLLTSHSSCKLQLKEINVKLLTTSAEFGVTQMDLGKQYIESYRKTIVLYC